MNPDIWQALANLAPIALVALILWAAAWAYVTLTEGNKP